MTSKISFSKLLKNNLKRRIWYSAVLTLVFFITMPMYVMIRYESKSSIELNSPRALEHLLRVQNSVAMHLGMSLVITMLAVSAGILGAWSGLYWLHSRKKMDLFASLPYKREKIFLLDAVTALVHFIGSYGVNLLLAFVIITAKGLMTGSAFKEGLIQFAILILYFLVFYGIAAFAMLLTGRIITGVLATGVLLGIVPGCKLLLETYMGFWETVTYRNLTDVQWSLLSSAAGLSILQNGRIAREDFSTMGIEWPVVIIAVATGLLMAGLCFLAVKKRPSEAAEKALAFEWSEGLIKACILYPVGLCGGLVVYYISGNEKTWLWFGIIFAVLVGNILMEIIYHSDRRRLLERKWWTVGSGAATLVTAAFFLFDLPGYDRWIPEEEEIEAAVAWENSGSYAIYPDGSVDVGDYLRRHIKDFTEEKLRVLAVEGVAHITEEDGKISETQDTADTLWAEANVYTSVHVCYQLKNGQKKERIYTLPVELWKETRDKLYQVDTYKEAMFPALLYDVELLKADYVSWMGDYKGLQMELTQSEQRELISIYMEELRDADAEMLFAKNSGSLSIIVNKETERPQAEYLFNGDDYPVNVHFVKTTAFLAARNFHIKENLNELNIQSVTVEKWDEETYEWQERTFKDKESIDEIIQNLDGSDEPLMVGDLDVLITYLNAQEEMMTAYCTYPTLADIPDIVMQFIEEENAEEEIEDNSSAAG